MQEGLTAVMFNYYADVYRAQLVPIPDSNLLPEYSPSDAVATHNEETYPVAPVVASEVLFALWKT